MTLVKIVDSYARIQCRLLLVSNVLGFRDLRGGVGYPPLPVGTKVAQTPVGARVKYQFTSMSSGDLSIDLAQKRVLQKL